MSNLLDKQYSNVSIYAQYTHGQENGVRGMVRAFLRMHGLGSEVFDAIDEKHFIEPAVFVYCSETQRIEAITLRPREADVFEIDTDFTPVDVWANNLWNFGLKMKAYTEKGFSTLTLVPRPPFHVDRPRQLTAMAAFDYSLRISDHGYEGYSFIPANDGKPVGRGHISDTSVAEFSVELLKLSESFNSRVPTGYALMENPGTYIIGSQEYNVRAWMKHDQVTRAMASMVEVTEGKGFKYIKTYPDGAVYESPSDAVITKMYFVLHTRDDDKVNLMIIDGDGRLQSSGLRKGDMVCCGPIAFVFCEVQNSIAYFAAV